MNRIAVARRRAAALLVAFVAVGALTAGGVVAAPASGAASGNQLTVTAGEYVYQTKGAPKPGWVTIEFDNKGVEYHMLAVIALKPGVTVKQLKQAVLSDDESAAEAVIDATKGDGGNMSGVPTLIGPKQVTTTITEMPAGHYGLLCFLPASSDGAPHAAHGMIKVLDVKGKKSSAKPPSDGVTDVTLNDGSIDFPLTNPGRNLQLKITNEGTTPHSFTLVKINEGKTLDDVKAYFDAAFNGEPPAGDPPGTLVGGVAAIAPGGMAYLEQTLTAGHYGYVSTEGEDPSSDDYTKGMHGEFDVK